ncbi:MobA/MobL family protein [Erythrobacter sp.]|uniref:MobA/MobL family protein n=1 Tax=Erythrobacter sp. TaxID=1042 RepID=UPI001425DF68|nr:MobA/MobL family protein [Erythrobacter sp.]QIQ86375.1 MAG: MobA/MobL family protein [Erythrobacter sp.]
MEKKGGQTVGELKRRLSALEQFADDSRNLPPLSVKEVRAHIERHGNDVAKARASMNGLIGKADPHTRKVGDDSHITGKVGGLEKRRTRVIKIWIDDAGHVPKIRYNQPITRPGRPVNSKGSTAIHFAFEAIDKAQLELGLPSDSGHKVSPHAHVEYIERAEAQVESVEALRKFAPAPIDTMIEYNERPGAVGSPSQSASGTSIFTNIRGDQADRVDVFKKLAELERLDRRPSLTLDLNHPSGTMQKIRRELVKGGELERWAPRVHNGSLVVEDAEAYLLAGVIGKMGWRDDRKKKARQKRQMDSSGVCFDPGKSGTCQIRLVGELPHDVSPEARVRIVKGVCEEFEKRGLPYIGVIHAPGPENHDRNWHFHLVAHDRPVARFDGTAASHFITEDSNGKIPANKVEMMRLALADPAVQAQIGKWDFEVAYTHTYKNRTRIEKHPFRRRKDRSVTREDFVPGLRAKLCDLTNAELERAGHRRRVDPLKHTEAGREQIAGEKLGAVLQAEELSGLPTKEGSRNESYQWKARRDALDLEEVQVVMQTYVTEEEKRTIRVRITDRQEQWALIDALAARRKEIAELKWVARSAREIIDRLGSRPSAVEQRNVNLMIAEGGKKKVDRDRLRTFERQADHAAEHLVAMQTLGGDLYHIERDAKSAIVELEREVETLEKQAGLRRERVFDFDIDESLDTYAKPTEVSDVTAVASPESSNNLRREASEVRATTREETAETIRAHTASRSVVNLDAGAGAKTNPLPASRDVAPTSPPTSLGNGEKHNTHELELPQEGVEPPSTKETSSAQRLLQREAIRKREASQHIGKLAKSGAAFKLTDQTVNGRAVKVAVLTPEEAQRHGLPERIVGFTNHEQKRLEGITAKRAARAQIWSLSRANPSLVSTAHDTAKSATVSSTGAPAQDQAQAEQERASGHSRTGAHAGGSEIKKDLGGRSVPASHRQPSPTVSADGQGSIPKSAPADAPTAVGPKQEGERNGPVHIDQPFTPQSGDQAMASANAPSGTNPPARPLLTETVQEKRDGVERPMPPTNEPPLSQVEPQSRAAQQGGGKSRAIVARTEGAPSEAAEASSPPKTTVRAEPNRNAVDQDRVGQSGGDAAIPNVVKDGISSRKISTAAVERLRSVGEAFERLHSEKPKTTGEVADPSTGNVRASSPSEMQAKRGGAKPTPTQLPSEASLVASRQDPRTEERPRSPSGDQLGEGGKAAVKATTGGCSDRGPLPDRSFPESPRGPSRRSDLVREGSPNKSKEEIAHLAEVRRRVDAMREEIVAKKEAAAKARNVQSKPESPNKEAESRPRHSRPQMPPPGFDFGW